VDPRLRTPALEASYKLQFLVKIPFSRLSLERVLQKLINICKHFLMAHCLWTVEFMSRRTTAATALQAMMKKQILYVLLQEL
jgi:hypothetical protein